MKIKDEEKHGYISLFWAYEKSKEKTARKIYDDEEIETEKINEALKAIRSEVDIIGQRKKKIEEKYSFLSMGRQNALYDLLFR